MIIFLIVLLLLICISLISLCILNKHLPIWFCKHVGWHLEPQEQHFDGCSVTGKCPRCGEMTLQDGQGNWF